jgi:hypothetical protein
MTLDKLTDSILFNRDSSYLLSKVLDYLTRRRYPAIRQAINMS